MAEHTPGPWYWDRFDRGLVHNDPPTLVLELASYYAPTLADKALIGASPDMHAALLAQAARDAHGRWNCTSCLCDDVACSVADELEATAIELREKALAKAKGE